jgi:hypothetical protein
LEDEDKYLSEPIDASAQPDDWLNTPEAKTAFNSAMTDLLSESDRGAALIAAETISNHLEESFRQISPEYFRRKASELVGYPGALSSLSARADVAALIGLIHENLYNAITMLRRIRNKAAHSNASFKLRDENDRLQELLRHLGPNLPFALPRFAGEILMGVVFSNLLDAGKELAEKFGTNPFSTLEEIADAVKQHPEAETLLEQRLPRMQLGLALWLMIGLMTLMRREFIAKQQTMDAARASTGRTVRVAAPQA